MPLSVCCVCPKCGKPQEATGEYIEAVTLVTKEAWVIECKFCGNVFADVGDL